MGCLILAAGKVAGKWLSFEIRWCFRRRVGFFLWTEAAGCDRQVLEVPISNRGRSERKVNVEMTEWRVSVVKCIKVSDSSDQE